MMTEDDDCVGGDDCVDIICGWLIMIIVFTLCVDD